MKATLALLGLFFASTLAFAAETIHCQSGADSTQVVDLQLQVKDQTALVEFAIDGLVQTAEVDVKNWTDNMTYRCGHTYSKGLSMILPFLEYQNLSIVLEEDGSTCGVKQSSLRNPQLLKSITLFCDGLPRPVSSGWTMPTPIMITSQCHVPPANDCSVRPKRLCCSCDLNGQLSCN